MDRQLLEEEEEEEENCFLKGFSNSAHWIGLD